MCSEMMTKINECNMRFCTPNTREKTIATAAEIWFQRTVKQEEDNVSNTRLPNLWIEKM